jgi:2,3-bisphosphoglycerate-dependent phosphoglycerate mutase
MTEYRQVRFALPAGATDLLVIRHGESAPAREDTPAPTRDGHSDPALDPVGVAQAEHLAERLAGESLDAIYVTTLQRTAQTAAPLAARLGLIPIEVADLREVYLGEWEGAKLRKYMAEGHPLATEMAKTQRWDVLPGAEPGVDFRARVKRGIESVAGAHPDRRVAVVVHGGVIGMIMAIALGTDSLAFSGADNASISEVVVSGDRWTIRRFNDTAHLDPLLSVTAAVTTAVTTAAGPPVA